MGAAYRLFQLRPQLFQRSLFDSGDIAAGNAEGGGNFSLGQRNSAAKSVAQANDFRLPLSQTFPHQPPQPQSAVAVIEVLQHGIVHTDDVNELQSVALTVRFNGFGQG